MLVTEETLQALVPHDKIDKLLVAKAIDFAVKYHGNALRDSGDYYYTHPIEVAKIVAQMQLDTQSIVTALLHDTVEDTTLTLADINEHFGTEIATLVDGVTKLKRVKLTKEQITQAEDFRKLVLAMIQDVRVLLVKLADRLHNMRTIEYKSEPKRVKISLETLEIYAPLAERIGASKIKNELQEIAFQNLHPDVYKIVINKLNEISANRQLLIHNIITELTQILESQGIIADIQGRAKTPYSIWTKMINKNISFDNLSDIIGFRILVESQQECYKTLGAIHSNYKAIPGKFNDFISIAKENGYQSLHTVIIGPMKRNVEIQIRTKKMHEIAELGLAAHWSYKQNYESSDIKNYRWIRELMLILANSKNSEELLQQSKLAMYDNQIFCFTPKGSIIHLPKKAITIDFAYAVHSNIGHHCIGAKINNKLAPLKTELVTGDVVEIITSKNHHPSAIWEDIVVTGKAKTEVKKFLRNQEIEHNLQVGKNLIENAFLSHNIQEFKTSLPSIAHKINKTIENLYLSVAKGEISPDEIVNLSNLKQQKSKSIFQLLKSKILNNETPKSIISGLVSGVTISFAKCCNPIPGDKIIGILYHGKGVTIHINECQVCTQSSLEKLFNISWTHHSQQNYFLSKIKLICQSDYRTIQIITNIMVKHFVNLLNLQVKKIDQFFNDITCDIEVSNLLLLNALIDELKTEKLVYSVTRV